MKGNRRAGDEGELPCGRRVLAQTSVGRYAVSRWLWLGGTGGTTEQERHEAPDALGSSARADAKSPLPSTALSIAQLVHVQVRCKEKRERA